MKISQEDWNKLAMHIMAGPLSEWRPGQREAWDLFVKGGGPVALISGRRVGKTANALRYMLYKMLTTPHIPCAFVSKTFSEAKQMAFQDPKFGLLRLIPDEMIAIKNLGDGYIELINGASLQLYGGRDPNKVRGRGFFLVIFDEPAFYLGGWEVIKNILIAFDVPKSAKRKDWRDVSHPVDIPNREIIFCTTPKRNEVTKQIFKKVGDRLLRIPTRAVLEYLDEEAKKEYYALKDTTFGRREFDAVSWFGRVMKPL